MYINPDYKYYYKLNEQEIAITIAAHELMRRTSLNKSDQKLVDKIQEAIDKGTDLVSEHTFSKLNKWLVKNGYNEIEFEEDGSHISYANRDRLGVYTKIKEAMQQADTQELESFVKSAPKVNTDVFEEEVSLSDTTLEEVVMLLEHEVRALRSGHVPTADQCRRQIDSLDTDKFNPLFNKIVPGWKLK